MGRHQIPSSPIASASSTSIRDSYMSYESHSTAPTSVNSTSENKALQKTLPPIQTALETPKNTLFTAASSTDSVATYDSILSEMPPLRREAEVDDYEEGEEDDEDNDYVLSDPSALDIPPVLPPYRGSCNDPPVRPSTPQDFARLFPSLDRLAIRHDDLTPDGNMNLRIDTLVPLGHGRRPLALQLFHLRMHDLAKREFSLRRYCRDSGREVCNSKRAYAEAPASPVADVRPALRRSMSSAFRSVATPFHRTSTSTSLFKRPGSSSASSTDTASVWSSSHHSTTSHDLNITSHPSSPKPKPRLIPTNRIKLEFSNYARVDVARRGGKNGKRYEFSWWGHNYAWKRVLDKNLNVVSFHLVRDGHGAPVAHIVPEMRSPNQVLGDEMAGAWVAPCYMWISDASVLDAITDVAE